jgi:hypothetical protein
MGTGLKCNRKIVERVEIDTLTHTHIYMTFNVSGIVQLLRKKRKKSKTKQKRIKNISQNKAFNNVIFYHQYRQGFIK